MDPQISIGLFDQLWKNRFIDAHYPPQVPMPPARPPGQMLGAPPPFHPGAVAPMMPPAMPPPAAPPAAEPVTQYAQSMEQLKQQLAGKQTAAALGNMGQGMINAKPQFGAPPPLPPPLQLPQQPVDMTGIQQLAQRRPFQQFGPMLGLQGRRA